MVQGGASDWSTDVIACRSKFMDRQSTASLWLIFYISSAGLPHRLTRSLSASHLLSFLRNRVVAHSDPFPACLLLLLLLCSTLLFFSSSSPINRRLSTCLGTVFHSFRYPPHPWRIWTTASKQASKQASNNNNNNNNKRTKPVHSLFLYWHPSLSRYYQISFVVLFECFHSRPSC
ncbi:hypothetical protein F4778DRAFT_148147 [Xylariomycetidae sp. FL2044]|nr:hypothetical protein F4778DRAFT_148147 [Xylariomycetidae sp. FL2044]